MKVEYVNKYLPVPRKSELQEFWHFKVIEDIRKMAETGKPVRIFRRGSRKYRILDRLSFGFDEIEIKDFDPKEIEDIELTQEIAYGAIIVEVPIYFADMSFGALCGNPNIAFAAVADATGCITGIGEGGLHPEVAKYKRFFVQWASGRFGIDINVLTKGIGITIKIGQGAKPGIGGHLPGRKVTEIISMVRRIPPGTDALSPAPHHDIYSIEDLGQRIWALKEATGKPVFVKVAATNYIPYIVSGIARMGADGVIIDGHGAGTGATPLTVRDHIGIPLELAVASADAILKREGLREGFTIIASGRVTSADDAAKLIALGADMVSIGTAGLIAMGCIMCHGCNTGKCPAGLASSLQNGSKIVDLNFAIERLKNFTIAFAYELKLILKHLGLKRLKDLKGRRNLLIGYNIDEETAKLLGISKIINNESLPPKFENEEVFLPKYVQYLNKLAETGDVIIVGQGSDAPPEVEVPKRLIDWIRIDGAQVTRPSIDPYREYLDLSIKLGRGEIEISEPLILRLRNEVKTYVNEYAFVAHLLNTLCDTSFIDGIEINKHLKHIMTHRFDIPQVKVITTNIDQIEEIVQYVKNKVIYVRLPSNLDILDDVKYLIKHYSTYVHGIIIDNELPKSDTDIEIVLVQTDKLLKSYRVRYVMDLIVHNVLVRDAGDIVKLIGLGADAVEISKLIEVVLRNCKNREEVIEKLVNLTSGLKKEIAIISGAAGVYSFHSSFTGNRELLRILDLKPELRRLLDIKLAGSW